MDDRQRVIRVLLAEDNQDLLEVLPVLIEAAGDMRCMAATDSYDSIPSLIEQHQIEVAILDLSLEGESALVVLPDLRTRFPATRFIIHSGHSEPEMQRKARDAGATDYVLKSGDPDVLIEAIRNASPV